MSISTELYMSILAMDSYNRGYDEGINVESGFPQGASFFRESDITALDPGVQSGFYAIAYTLGADNPAGLAAGTTVIAYRGTGNIDPLGHGRSAIGGEIF